MFNVNNKNILITGATSGIGKESALALAKMGANITFIARNKEKQDCWKIQGINFDIHTICSIIIVKWKIANVLQQSFVIFHQIDD